MKISAQEAQRLLNECADEVEPEEPIVASLVVLAVVFALSAAAVISGLYWVWRAAHG